VLVVAIAGLLFCAPLAPASRGQDELKQARAYVQQATAAYRAKDFAAYLENLKRALALRPDHPTIIYNLAGAHALAGNQKEALALLARVARMGLVYPAARDDDFNAIKETAEFKDIVARFEANKSHVGQSAVAFTLAERGLVTEGIAYDPAEDAFYVSSAHRRKIIRVGAGGAAKDFATERDGLWAAMGMRVDAGRRTLWVATSALPQMTGFTQADKGRSGIFKYDLSTGRLIKKYLIADAAKQHLLGDLTINSSGDVFATDSASAAIYTVNHKKDELELFAEGSPLASPQGLDFSADGRRLFVADYPRGIFVMDVATKQWSRLAPPDDATLLAIDGLYFHNGSLVAIQNDVNPHRVIRIRLSKDQSRAERVEVVEANNPMFNEPTLGVIARGMFYYVAASQWGAVDNNGKLAPEDRLRDHVILKTKL
jgi:hypothetical protein